MNNITEGVTKMDLDELTAWMSQTEPNSIRYGAKLGCEQKAAHDEAAHRYMPGLSRGENA
jgi:hypothetical protein